MDIDPKALFEYLSDDLRASGIDVEAMKIAPASDFWPGASPREVAALRLWHSLFKKLNDDVSPDADARCLEKFLASNRLCQEWELNLLNSRDEMLFGLFEQEVSDFLHHRDGTFLIQSYFDLLGRGRAGPGASLGANGVDFYTKFFSSKLSATSSELYSMYNEYLSWYADWVDAELSRAINCGVLEIFPGNSLSFVRKTRDISRSICTEPSLNMFYQLGLGAILSDRLREHFNVDLETQQTWNRSMACRGSEADDLVTIDLESASDSVSCSLIDRVCPGWFSDILYTIRSPKVLINGEWVRLDMISSMGNGFTFPLQTMLFSCVVRAALAFRGIAPLMANQELVDDQPTRGTWGVFGDDIICHREVADDVCRLLTLLGFRVNSTKSYFQGPFRESCGADYYNGQLVRGVYIRSLRTTQSRYVAINRLNEWSAVTGIYLPRTVGYLCDSVRFLAVPYWEADDAGIRTESPTEPVAYDANFSFLYRKYEVDVPQLEVGDSTLRPVPRFRGLKPPRRRIYNPSGLLCSFLAGYVRNCLISLALKQGERPRYRTVVKTAPSWFGLRPGTGFAADSRFWMPRVIAALRANVRMPEAES